MDLETVPGRIKMRHHEAGRDNQLIVRINDDRIITMWPGEIQGFCAIMGEIDPGSLHQGTRYIG
ncbi:hypothetical protein AO398_01650 [Methylobacterium sp. GXS13]|nr:hypothetical protein AO398_01650 [Methylobacterium sp. GXS13]